MTQEDNLMVEEKFLITEQGYTVGRLLDRYRMSDIVRQYLTQ